MILTIIDKNFSYAGFIDIFESLRVIKKYNSTHEFELRIPFSIKALELFALNNMFFYEENDLVNCFIVESRELNLNNTGESIILKGRDMLSFFDRRIIKGTVKKLNTEVVNVLVAIWNTLAPDRTFSKSNINFYWETQKIDYQNSWGNMLEEFEKICLNANLGLTAYFKRSTTECIFTTYKGLNRSINQSTNKPVIFSREFGNIQEQKYNEICKDYKNTAFIGGEGEGTSRKIVTISNGSYGFARKEMFVDARDIQKTIDNVTLTDTEYNNLLTRRGNEKLKEQQEIRCLEGKIINLNNYEYKVDWNLGDIVTIEDKIWGITMDTRITQVEETYSNGIIQVIPTFGDSKPTLIQKIKKMR